jgi:hypothetical protein
VRLACVLALSACIFAEKNLAQDNPPTVTFGTTVVIPSGLQGRVYHLKRDTKRLPDFARLKPAGTIYTSSLNVPPQDFRQGFPGVTKRFEWFAIDYTGRFWIEKPGAYDFALTSDDGAALFIDDRLVIDNDGTHAPVKVTGGVDLGHGVHRIRVSYFQGPRLQVALVLEVAPPGEPARIFSTDEFKPPPDTLPEPKREGHDDPFELWKVIASEI